MSSLVVASLQTQTNSYSAVALSLHYLVSTVLDSNDFSGI